MYIYIYILTILYPLKTSLTWRNLASCMFLLTIFFLIKFCPAGTSIAEHFYLKKVFPGKVALDFLLYF